VFHAIVMREFTCEFMRRKSLIARLIQPAKLQQFLILTECKCAYVMLNISMVLVHLIKFIHIIHIHIYCKSNTRFFSPYLFPRAHIRLYKVV